jgi:hypothetical protein
MATLDFESRRLETSRIIHDSIKKVFGNLEPLTDIYMKMGKLSQILASEIEKETLVWESDIRSDYEKNKKYWKKFADGTFRTDTRGWKK